MRKRNWRQYNKTLVQRGSLTFLVDIKSMKTLLPKRQKRKGRPLEFSDQFIEMLLMIKIHYKMPYRMLEGFTRFFFEQVKLFCRVPTYSLTCKRAKGLSLHLPKLSSRRPTTVIVDATGIKVEGEGEWKVKIHGKGRPRKWIKIHITIDEKTQEIVGEVSSESSLVDGKAFPSLFKQVPKNVKTVIGDGAYNDKVVRRSIQSRGAKVLIPPKHAVCRGRDKERDRAVLDIRSLGGDKIAKSLWGKLSGYSRRVLVETSFSRYKRMFGDKFYSKTPERRLVENRLKCVILNKMMKVSV
jgi:hypothetical protein